MATVKYDVDPISRIEGHLGVKVTVDSASVPANQITEANAHGNLWRGFENFLIGRRANDAITFTQRICGVCPVPHGTAATFAADSVMGVSSGYATFSSDQYVGADGVPAAALHVRNIVLASEFLMSSITHFYHLVAQSYVQGPPIPPWTPYFADANYHALLKSAGKTLPVQNSTGTYAGLSADLWSAVITQYVKALRIRRLTFEAGAMFAGRMPMMSNSVAGGTTNAFRTRQDFDDKCNAYRKLMEEVGTFVVREYVPLTLALGALYPDFDNAANTGVSPATAGKGWGAGLGNFLAWGAFPQADGTMGLNGGVVVDSTAVAPTVTRLLETRVGAATVPGSLAYAKAQVEANLKEIITCSYYANSNGFDTSDSAYPGAVTATEPNRDTTGSKYSWMKAPRWNGYAMEVGPLARMVVNDKYPVKGQAIVGGAYGAGAAYAGIYVNAGALDARVLHPDLVSGLVGNGTTTNVLTPVATYVAGVKGGLSTMDRLRARAIESFWMCAYILGVPTKDTNGVVTFPASGGWLGALQALGGGTTVPAFYRDTVPPVGTVSGYGLVEAPRGALGHFVTATGGKINSYQCVVPTTWNGSPKDGTAAPVAPNVQVGTHRGAIEQAMIGCVFDATPIPAGQGNSGRISGVEVLRIAQSFDPCIACAVH